MTTDALRRGNDLLESPHPDLVSFLAEPGQLRQGALGEIGDGVDFRLRDGRIRTQRAATRKEKLQVDLLMSLQNRLEEMLEGAILGMGDRDLTELTVGEIELSAGRVIGDLDHLLFEESGGGHVENEERQQMERNHEDPGASPGLEEAPYAVPNGVPARASGVLLLAGFEQDPACGEAGREDDGQHHDPYRVVRGFCRCRWLLLRCGRDRLRGRRCLGRRGCRPECRCRQIGSCSWCRRTGR